MSIESVDAHGDCNCLPDPYGGFNIESFYDETPIGIRYTGSYNPPWACFSNKEEIIVIFGKVPSYLTWKYNYHNY